MRLLPANHATPSFLQALPHPIHAFASIVRRCTLFEGPFGFVGSHMDLVENQHMQCNQLTMHCHCLCSQGNHQPNSVLWHFKDLPYAVEHFKLCLYLALCQHTNLVVCLLLWKSREILDLTSATAGLHTPHRLHSAPRLPAARLSQLCAARRAAHTISWSWSSPRTSRPSPSPSWWRRRRRRLWSRWSRRRRRWRWWRPGGTRVWCSRVWLVWGTRVCCWTPGFGPRVRAFRWINYFFSLQCNVPICLNC